MLIAIVDGESIQQVGHYKTMFRMFHFHHQRQMINGWHRIMPNLFYQQNHLIAQHTE